MVNRKKKIIVTLTKDDFSKFPNDKELGAHARAKFTEQLEKYKADNKDYKTNTYEYGENNWIYPIGHRNI